MTIRFYNYYYYYYYYQYCNTFCDSLNILLVVVILADINININTKSVIHIDIVFICLHFRGIIHIINNNRYECDGYFYLLIK